MARTHCFEISHRGIIGGKRHHLVPLLNQGLNDRSPKMVDVPCRVRSDDYFHSVQSRFSYKLCKCIDMESLFYLVNVSVCCSN